MQWSSSATEGRPWREAVAQLLDETGRALGQAEPDLILLNATAHYRPVYGNILRSIRGRYPRARLWGCSASGVIGGGRELENVQALSLTAARLPGVSITPLELSCEPDSDAPMLMELAAAGPAQLILLCSDPYSCPAEPLLSLLDGYFPGVPKLGGIASGADGPGEAALFNDEDVQRVGMSGLVLRGELGVDTLVAQGCRPLGQPLFVTGAEGMKITGLDGKPPLEVLGGLVRSLEGRDRALARQAVFLGIAMTEARSDYRQGDFLIRNLLGVDPENGHLAVSASLRPNTVVQFHLRDAQAADQELRSMLDSLGENRSGPHAGALMFSCLGRGSHLYGEADHDTRALRDALGPIPVGGFFCNGEFGPVGGSSFLHGYTSAVALFRGSK